MSKKKIGMCHICGKQSKLTFDHVPPKSLGNNKKTRSYRVVDMVKNERISSKDTEGLRYQQKQQGFGQYSLCDECNSKMGTYYVNHFNDSIRAIYVDLQEQKDTEQYRDVILETSAMYVLPFVKQVISMFCTITEEGSMLDFKEFLLNKESTSFPKDKYRLTMFIVPDKNTNTRITNWTKILFKTPTNSFVIRSFAELVFYPVGFQLYNLSESTDKTYEGCDITDMCNYKYDETPHFKMPLPYKKVDNIFPGCL